jgi:hypothetical protein
MDALTAFRLLAVTGMLICYGLEPRSKRLKGGSFLSTGNLLPRNEPTSKPSAVSRWLAFSPVFHGARHGGGASPWERVARHATQNGH